MSDQTLEEAWAQLEATALKIKSQRDDLLAALRTLMQFCERYHWPVFAEQEVPMDKARAAIERAGA